jgi:molybdopterin synthase catalytic subunit
VTDAPTRIAYLSDRPLDVAALEAAVEHPAAGARALFRGVVRDHDHGRAVTRLEYQAHPSAESVLAEVVAEFAVIDGVLGVAASHRVGTLEIGDVALVVAVSCAHRREAFETCAQLVDEIKHRLPVWKRQVFDDGTDEWVNCP